MLRRLLSYPLPELVITVGYGFAVFYLIVGLGLFRASPFDPIVTGTWLAAGSGLMWYFASVVPLIWPEKPYSSAACNIAAASFAAASASFLVPEDKLLLIKTTFGLG